MNLGDILNTVGDICDLNPTQSPTARARFLRFINLGLSDLLVDAPYLFRANQRRFAVPASLSPTAAEAFDIDSDPWLLKLDSTTAAVIDRWRFDDTHCTQAIYLTDSAGTKRRRIIQGVAKIGVEMFVTITEPWPNTTDTGLKWEVTTEDFYLPKDLEGITALRLADAENTWYRDIELIGEFDGRATNNGLFTGNPWTAYPGGDFNIPSLGVPMTNVSSVASGAFTIDLPGTHQYVYTVSWGRRPEAMGRPSTVSGVTARYQPLIESPPSAVLEVVSTVNNQNTITIPDIRIQFAQQSGTKSHFSLVAYKVNIYKAVKGRRFLLWETIDAGTVTAVDNGSTIPDFYTPLPRAPGCRSLTFDAIPAEQIIIDGTWAAPELYEDQDEPGLDSSGVRALIELTVERVQRKLNNATGAAQARARYQTILRGLANKDGSNHDPSRPIRRKTRRVGQDLEVRPRYNIDYDYGN